uniref:Metalloregulator ArsR/SmtB family transcription factor n=1 Tax=Roseihalotalea indica TaxID=2867963 RepID=A0AA49JK51_9BACT|nr:metalloregulator ArsR/SmtB family transcription factor [Tunicatimonas sp. TK19036]
MKRDIFQAIADPTRRAILVLIAAQAMTPNALAEQFDTTRQAVSKHIKILKECEVVEQQKMGREIYYHFKPEKMQEIDGWLEQFRQHWETRFNQLDQVLSNLKSQNNEQ